MKEFIFILRGFSIMQEFDNNQICLFDTTLISGYDLGFLRLSIRIICILTIYLRMFCFRQAFAVKCCLYHYCLSYSHKHNTNWKIMSWTLSVTISKKLQIQILVEFQHPQSCHRNDFSLYLTELTCILKDCKVFWN